jgi:TPR repeat protein
MRRQNVHLMAQARHDPAARLELGRRYLQGIEGLPRHIETGLGYLGHPSLKDGREAAIVIADCLSLREVVSHRQEAALVRAATAGSATAQFKLAVWLCLRHGQTQACARWLEAASAGGHVVARRARAAFRSGATLEDMVAFARSVAQSSDLEIDSIAALAAKALAEEADLDRLSHCLRIALAVTPRLTIALASLVVKAVHLCEESGRQLQGLSPCQIEACLELIVTEDDHRAEYLLGRALCSISCGALQPASLVSGGNLRKGSALLLRAADGGCHDAWMQLYRVHADHRCSVANPQMARFFLEKAAIQGTAEAQRRLGALILRSASDLKSSEHGIHWLYEASRQGDSHASRLLKSLVLPLEGDDDEAGKAIDAVRHTDPWLAVRLRMSRDFGLTKLEALCVDPIDGRRGWGLVVGKNRFVGQNRVAAPRAVPALSPAALDNLQRAAAFFEQAQRDGDPFEGDWRRRSLRQRRAFARHQIDEAMFFARVSSATLDSLRQGTKWALRTRPTLQLALAG